MVDLLTIQVIKDLQSHAELGGIEVKFNHNETIGAYITKLVNAKVSKPGAVAQHLIGAKLEYKFREADNIIIDHHSSSTADVQTNRLGDFDIGNTVIHVTKTPNSGHFQKAYVQCKVGKNSICLGS